MKRTLLENGLRLITIPQKESLATTIMVLVEAGSKYETKDLNGISHFLEHMCFKGTTKRPKPIDIAGELDGLGAEYNAFTSHETTSYFVKVKNSGTKKALDIIADMYLNPAFPKEEIEKEKGVIIEEINMYEDMPSRRVSELFMELLYGDQPAGWSIAGRKEVVKKITREDFITYRGQHYIAPATTIVVSGGFEENAMIQEIKKAFRTLPRGDKGGKKKVKETQSAPQELIHFKKSDQTHLIMGFRAFALSDPRRYALEVLVDILGGGMGSRLFQRIREEMGAAYYVRAGADLLSDHGMVEMSAGVDHTKIASVITAGLEEFTRMKTEKVSEEELQRAKDHIIGHLFLSLETSDEVGGFYGEQEVMRMPLLTPQAIAMKIKKVTAVDIQRVAKTLFKNQTLNLALIGPYKKKSFRNILKI